MCDTSLESLRHLVPYFDIWKNNFSFAYFQDIVKPDIPSESLTHLVFANIVIKW